MLSLSCTARVSSAYRYLQAGSPSSAFMSAVLRPARLGQARLHACAASASGSRRRLERTSRCWATLSASVDGVDRGDRSGMMMFMACVAYDGECLGSPVDEW